MTTLIDRIDMLLWTALPIEDEDDLLAVLEKSNTDNFDKEKLEKDFYLTILLQRISINIPELTFKGGTCLNKVYFPYFRLSEDLDFSISIDNPLVDTNNKRQKFAYSIRDKLKELCKYMNRTLDDDEHHHKKAQWNKHLKTKEYTYLKYVISYPSLFSKQEQTIKIEVTYTSKQHLPSQTKDIQAIFIDPILEDPIFDQNSIVCLSLEEMMAEKMRAALTRQFPAIRDFFDIRYVKNQGFDFTSIKELIDYKVAESEWWYTIDDHYDALRIQIENDLDPVLGKKYPDFDFNQIYNFVLSFKH